MKIQFVLISCLVALHSSGQMNSSGEEKWGVVLEHPQMKTVILKSGIIYGQDLQDSLKLDIYLPSQVAKNEKRAAIIFLPEQLKGRHWEIYKTWPRLVAAYGLIGIVIDVNKSNYIESIKKALDFLSDKKQQYNIDTDQYGIFAASHIPDGVITKLIQEDHIPAIKAIALYYREPTLQGPFRKDLPVLFVTDDQLYFTDTRYSALFGEVQKSKAPWTIRFGTGMPHFFDAFADNVEARKIIRETIYFWKNHLEPILHPTSKPAEERQMIAALYSGDRVRAAHLLKLWLSKNPDDRYALLRYGMVMYHEKNYAEAEEAYKKVKDLEPVYMIDLVKILFAVDKPAEAEQYLLKALNSGKLSRSPFSAIGSFLYSLGKYKEGVMYYEKIIEAQRTGPEYFHLACGYARINEKDKALNALNNAIAKKCCSPEMIENAEDLRSLTSDDRFKALLLKLK